MYATLRRYPYATTGIVATLGKGKPVIGLRSDIDALPIEEQADVPYRCAYVQISLLNA